MTNLNHIAAVLRADANRKPSLSDIDHCAVDGCNNKTSRVCTLCPACLLAAAEACEAAAKLPITADGVPVVPYVDVVYSEMSRITNRIEKCYDWAYIENRWHAFGAIWNIKHPINRCYSTAAAAALASGGKA